MVDQGNRESMVDQGIAASRRLRSGKAPEEGAAGKPQRTPASIDGPLTPGVVSAGYPEAAILPPRDRISPPPAAAGAESAAPPDTSRPPECQD
jgi:hypothetical protein